MLKNFLYLIRINSNVKLIKAHITFFKKSYLTEQGWYISHFKKRPLNKYSEPIPWLTYPFMDFLSPRLTKEFNIFEFGSGNSTIFFSKRIRNIISIESNYKWYNEVKACLPSNAQIIYRESNNYADAILDYKKSFDIVIIDGVNRNECAKNTVNALKDNGVIILDNSNRIEYLPTFELFQSQGFKNIPFWGMAPGSSKLTCTTIFYRPINCLNI